MDCSFFISATSLLSGLLGCVEAIKWTELSIGELSHQDERKRVVVAKGAVRNEFAIRLTCPMPYVIYPRNDDEAAKTDRHVFVEAGGSLVEVPLSKVIHGLYGKPTVRVFQDEENNVMEIHYPNITYLSRYVVDIIRGRATHIYLLCSLPHTSLHHDLLSKLRYLNVVVDSSITVSRRNEIAKYLKGRNSAIGMFSIDISSIHKATHGCGSLPTRPFLNAADYDDISGVRSCTVDITEHPDVGFYCDGTIQPTDCFYKLLNSETSNEINIGGLVDVKRSSNWNWYFATYYRKGIIKGFNGYCKCVDVSTGEVTAQINIMTGMSHECDINGMILKNKVQPIIGNWCDVALLPGSTLTIKVPINIYDTYLTQRTNRESTQSRPTLLHSSIYPQDMKNAFLNHTELSSHIHPPIVYKSDEYMTGDALHIDQSKEKDDGIITVTYLENSPLSYPPWFTGLTYTWNLDTDTDRLNVKDTVAIVNLVPVVTHDYYMTGCEPPTSSIFYMGNGYNAHRQDLEIYGHKMRLCHTTLRFRQNYGLYCPPGHAIEPKGCEKYGFNAVSQGLEHWKGFAVLWSNEFLSSMRIFTRALKMSPRRKCSLSCSCVDKDGIERARLVVSNSNQQSTHFIRLGYKESMSMVVPSVNIIDGGIEGERLPEIQEIPFPFPFPNKTILLYRGTSRFLNGLVPFINSHTRFINLNGRTEPFLTHRDNVVNDNMFIGVAYNQWECSELSNHEALFLPLNVKKYFYREVNTDGARKLVPVEYSKVLGTNAAGFKVETKLQSGDIYDYDSITLMNPMSSIIVSKTNEVINLKYAYGKLTSRCNIIENVVGDTMDDGLESIDEAEYLDVEFEANYETEIMNLEDNQSMSLATPDSSGSNNAVMENGVASTTTDVKETRSLTVFGVINIAIHPTDPYLHGCGINDPSEELFRDDTVPLLNNANENIGCEVDIAEGDASFYCPRPYHTEPPNCMPTTPGGALRVSRPGKLGNRHFHVFTKTEEESENGTSNVQGTTRETFECHCVTNTGLRMVTIRVHT
ncbi:hypothetical protein BgAZ_404860 [Babesia gibsoni]|uniref:6-Cys domain-containing protein n=1 Tax=Babesia gibsoni TaxID=33632 RepID=A0AAD8PDQ1_BABGI|nr:hypothetical protein BgAZ_404860 [Babesia gibsoni]